MRRNEYEQEFGEIDIDVHEQEFSCWPKTNAKAKAQR